MTNKVIVSMDSKLWKFHNFMKSSLVTEKGGFDYYTCEDCGLKGKRFGIDDNIELVRPNKKKMAKCDGTKGSFNIESYEQKIRNVVETGSIVKIKNDTNLFSFDLKNGDILKVIECPKTEDKSLSGVWVVKDDGSTLRLLPNEYSVMEK